MFNDRIMTDDEWDEEDDDMGEDLTADDLFGMDDMTAEEINAVRDLRRRPGKKREPASVRKRRNRRRRKKYRQNRTKKRRQRRRRRRKPSNKRRRKRLRKRRNRGRSKRRRRRRRASFDTLRTRTMRYASAREDLWRVREILADL